jgi:hypothetical protein
MSSMILFSVSVSRYGSGKVVSGIFVSFIKPPSARFK